MRNKDMLNSFEDVTILCQFLYMNPVHYITVDNGMAKIEVRMDEHGYFFAKNLNFPELPDFNWTETMNVRNMLTIIYQLKNDKPEVWGESFNSRWDEIKNITLHNIALNRIQ